MNIVRVHASLERKSKPIYENSVPEQRDRQPVFYKVETNLDRLLVTEMCVIPNFVNTVRAALKNVNRSLGQADSHPVDTYIDRLFMPEVYVILNFVKMVRPVLGKVNICVCIHICNFTSFSKK